MKRLTSTEALLELRSWMDSGRHVELREWAGIPQRAIADDVGVTKACVTRWERLQRRPSGNAALAYHRVLRRLAEAAAAEAVKGTSERTLVSATAPPRNVTRSATRARCEAP